MKVPVRGDCMAKILMVEDDERFADDICLWLRKESHVVEIARTGAEALDFMRAFQYDLVILDWQLPDTDGIAVCRLARLAGGKFPILMLTGKAAIENKELGLDSGADDYLVKPPDLRELSARIRALLRRESNNAPVIKIGDLVLMPASRKITRHGIDLELTPKEFSLLEFMTRHRGVVFSADQLLDRVWSSETDASSHTVRVCINRIRQKISDQNSQPNIRTIYGIGYILD